MGRFSFKLLAFYGLSIVSVIVLFKVVTAYGNTSLKAPDLIDGSYRLNAEALPGCLKSDSLVLTIKQSGTYLFGTLRPANATAQVVTSAAQKPSLSGRFNNQQISLSGSLPHLKSCAASGSKVKIQSTLDQDILNGQIRLSSNPTTAEFTAKKDPPEEKSETKP